MFPWYDVITCKSKQIFGCALFRRFFSVTFWFLDVPKYSDVFDYIKGKRPAVYFKNQKKLLHIIFKTSDNCCRCRYLVQFYFCLILQSSDVSHCQAVPLISPAENLPVKVAEDSAFTLPTKHLMNASTLPG